MTVNDYEHQCYDDINTEIAKVALRTLNDHTDFKVKPEAIETATKGRPICRFEEFYLPNSCGEKIHVILDVCHNQPGFGAMYATMAKKYGKSTLRVGFGDNGDA